MGHPKKFGHYNSDIKKADVISQLYLVDFLAILPG
jgi:hypothetical protein